MENVTEQRDSLEDVPENMRVKELKAILENLPDDMDIIIPVVNAEDVNNIIRFNHVRTAGILENVYEESPALCINTAEYGVDIETQIKMRNDSSTSCAKVLF